jgi:hypothetical protein
MKNAIILMLGLLFITSCDTPAVVTGVEKAQLRNTQRDGFYQFNVDLLLEIRRQAVLEDARVELVVNGTALGKAILAADTRPLEAGSQKIGLRVLFPNTKLVLTTPNHLEINGFLQFDNGRIVLDYKVDSLVVMNLTGM